VRVDRQQLIDVLVNADQLQNRIPEIARILGRLESVDQQKEESVADLSRRGRSGSQSSVVDSGNITVFAVDPTQLKCESWVINRDLANIDDFKKAIFAAGAEQENGDAMDGANEDEDRRESGQPVFFQSCEYAAVDQAQFRALEELINII
jgi:hypothetical protein